MASVLVVYGTNDWQTAKVAEYIGSVLTDRGHDSTTARVQDGTDLAPEDFDAILVGSPVNYRRHLPEVVGFVERHRDVLSERPTGFFQLSLTSLFPFRWVQEGEMAFVDGLAEETGWRPDRVGLFAGAIKYSQYDPWTRFAFKLVSMLTTGDTDTSRDYEYTDWDEVERFAGEFADYVESRVIGASRTRTRTRIAVRIGRRALVVLAGVGFAAAAYRAITRRTRARQEMETVDEPGGPEPESGIERVR